MYPIIGFCGPATAGKTTAANSLQKHGFRRMSFADPLRDMLRALGVTDHNLFFDKEAPLPCLCGKSARWALQRLGTEWGRGMIGDEVWIQAARERLQLRSTPVVFDDVRFENEAALIIEMGGLVAEITRPGIEYSEGHASERGLRSQYVTHRVHALSVEDLEGEVSELIEAD